MKNGRILSAIHIRVQISSACDHKFLCYLSAGASHYRIKLYSTRCLNKKDSNWNRFVCIVISNDIYWFLSHYNLKVYGHIRLKQRTITKIKQSWTWSVHIDGCLQGNTRFCMLGCVGGVRDKGSEWKIREQSSNSI